MKIKIKYIIGSIILSYIGFWYLKAWYIFITRFKYYDNLFECLLNPFYVDAYGIFNHTIAIDNAIFGVTFIVVNAILISILIFCVIKYINDKEIEIL